MSDSEAISHLYKVFYEDLGLCGCGVPASAYDLVRDLLALCPLYENQRWRQAEGITGGGAVHHVVMSSLDTAELIEHGSSINGSWLTPKGVWFLNASRKVPFEQLDDAGLPHDGEPCEDRCWKIEPTLPDS